MNRDDIVEAIHDLEEQLTRGCQMNHCLINPPTGMAPNGGCRCTKDQIARKLRQLADDIMTIKYEDWKTP